MGRKGLAPRTEHVCLVCHRTFDGPVAMKCCSAACRAKLRAADRASRAELGLQPGYKPYHRNARHCERCGSRLNYLNKGRLCLPCQGKRIDMLMEGT